MSERKNRQWRLAARPVGNFKDSDFRWTEEPVRSLEDGEILVHSQYLSLDPTNRGWAARDTYLPAVKLGDVMRGGAIGVVEESRNSNFAVGDHVSGETTDPASSQTRATNAVLQPFILTDCSAENAGSDFQPFRPRGTLRPWS